MISIIFHQLIDWLFRNGHTSTVNFGVQNELNEWRVIRTICIRDRQCMKIHISHNSHLQSHSIHFILFCFLFFFYFWCKSISKPKNITQTLCVNVLRIVYVERNEFQWIFKFINNKMSNSECDQSEQEKYHYSQGIYEVQQRMACDCI